MSSPLIYPSSESGTRLPTSTGSGSARRTEGFRHQRGDLFTSSTASPRLRTFDMGSDRNSQASTQDGISSDNPEDIVRVIWGTNISIQEVANSFKDFLLFFTKRDRRVFDGEDVSAGEYSEKTYLNMLRNMLTLGTSNLNLDVCDLESYRRTRKLAHQLINYPQEVIPIMDQTIKECMASLAADDSNLSHQQIEEEIETKYYKVLPYNLREEKGMRELNPGDIDKLVSIKGLVLRSTSIIPDMKAAFFRCSICSHTMLAEIDRGSILEPTTCPRPACASLNSMELIHVRSHFADKQIIRLQETPNHVPDGQTPHSISVIVYDDLVDVCRAGDRVQMTGVFRSVPIRVNPQQRTLKNLYKTYIDVFHIQKSDSKRLGADISTLGNTNLEAQYADEITQQDSTINGNSSSNANGARDAEDIRRATPEDVQRIHDVAERPDVYELLARSIAPSIFEQDDVKKGLLLQLFGGTNKKFTKGGSPRYRGDINILLCGDPSTSKSQILQYINKIAPRGMYTSGKGSSAVGLTAYVTRDQETKQLVLESGALVLSDGGICCIDEFDKMNDGTRSVLHEVMEQQTVSVAKAGIITTLNARTSILASANPIGSKYNPDLSVIQNIDLPPTLLSRFDLVYLMLDKVDERADRQLARHLASMYLEDNPLNASQYEILPIEFLTTYITYAKEHIHPTITPEAKEELVNAYVEMRKLGDDVRSNEKRITATTRQLESMIRLSEGHAKMRLSPTVRVDDVKEAVRLIRSAIKDYATDPKTGRIDMNMVQTGTSMAQRVMQSSLKEEMLKIIDSMTSNGNVVKYSDLTRRITEEYPESLSSFEIAEAARALAQEGFIVVTGDGPRRTIRRVTGQVTY